MEDYMGVDNNNRVTVSADAAHLDAISIDELRSLWPHTEEGRLCARLVLRWGFTTLVESAYVADCNAVSAQAEAAANKAIAKMLKDFGTVTHTATPPEPRKPMAALNRFNQQPQQQQPQINKP
jgi:hypothetical protein